MKQWTERESWEPARKKVWEAVGALVGEGALGKRLAYANVYLGHLLADNQRVDQMPERARMLIRSIDERMRLNHKGGSGDNGVIDTSASEGDKLAEDIFSLYTELNGGI